MASFDDIQCEGLCQAGLFKGPIETYGQFGTPAASTLDLLTGTTHNAVLPGYNSVGPMVFPLSAAGTPVLGGINIANTSTQQGQIIYLANVGSIVINTATSDSGSSAGNQFSAAVQIAVGAVVQFMYVGDFWMPVFPAAVS
jgi:hypothetical protein